MVEVAFIHGGTLFTNGKDTGAAEVGKKDLAGVLLNVNQYLGVESEVSMNQDARDEEHEE